MTALASRRRLDALFLNTGMQEDPCEENDNYLISSSGKRPIKVRGSSPNRGEPAPHCYYSAYFGSAPATPRREAVPILEATAPKSTSTYYNRVPLVPPPRKPLEHPSHFASTLRSSDSSWPSSSARRIDHSWNDYTPYYSTKGTSGGMMRRSPRNLSAESLDYNSNKRRSWGEKSNGSSSYHNNRNNRISWGSDYSQVTDCGGCGAVGCQLCEDI